MIACDNNHDDPNYNLTNTASRRNSSDSYSSSSYSKFPPSSSLQRHLPPSSSSSRSPSPSSQYCSPPSPSPSSSSGRHTSRILIKSNPPAPPKRHTTTTLTRRRRDSSSGLCHHLQQEQHYPSPCCHSCHNNLSSNNHRTSSSLAKHNLSTSSLTLTRQRVAAGRSDCPQHHHYHHCHHHSPPSSPSSSSGISCGSATQQNSLPRRCKSFDELSHSSNEDTAIWDEIGSSYSSHNTPNHPIYEDKCHYYTPKGGSSIPVPPSILKPPNNTIKRPQKSANMSGGAPPLPPPQPPIATAERTQKQDLASALSVALKRRNIEVGFFSLLSLFALNISNYDTYVSSLILLFVSLSYRLRYPRYLNDCVHVRPFTNITNSYY